MAFMRIQIPPLLFILFLSYLSFLFISLLHLSRPTASNLSFPSLLQRRHFFRPAGQKEEVPEQEKEPDHRLISAERLPLQEVQTGEFTLTHTGSHTKGPCELRTHEEKIHSASFLKIGAWIHIVVKFDLKQTAHSCTCQSNLCLLYFPDKVSVGKTLCWFTAAPVKHYTHFFLFFLEITTEYLFFFLLLRKDRPDSLVLFPEQLKWFEMKCFIPRVIPWKITVLTDGHILTQSLMATKFINYLWVIQKLSLPGWYRVESRFPGISC